MIQGRVILTLDDLAVQNAAPRYLVELENGQGYAVVRQVGKVTVADGKACNLEAVTRLAQAVLERSPKALSYPEGRQLLAMAVLGMFASANLRLNEQGREVANVDGPASPAA